MTAILHESFEWMGPEFKVDLKYGKGTVRIRGVAMRKDVISKNNRHYVKEELKRSARTWNGKPVCISHDKTKIAGHVEWMEYNDVNESMEYIADINKQPYVDMLRNKSAEIRGVSIGADFLHMLCPKCNKKFYTEEEWTRHMQQDEYIHDLPKEPHGIIGQELSLVLSSEVPGYSDTSIELMEVYEKPVSRLLETITQTKMEQEKYMEKIKAAVTTPPRIAATLNYPQPAQESTGKSEPIPPAQTTQKEAVVKEGKIAEPCSPELKACVDALIADGKDESSAWAICKSKLGETVKLTVKESANIAKLDFIPEGYPYTSVEEYIKVTGKGRKEWANDNDQVDERNKHTKEVIDKINEMLARLNEAFVVAVPTDDLGWKQFKDDLGWKDIKPYDDKPLREMITAIPKDDLRQFMTKEEFETSKKTLLETVTVELRKYDDVLKAVEVADKAVLNIEAKDKAKDEKIAEMQKTIDEMKAKLKESEEKQLKETVRIDNLEDKGKADFKGHTKGLQAHGKNYAVDPATERR